MYFLFPLPLESHLVFYVTSAAADGYKGIYCWERCQSRHRSWGAFEILCLVGLGHRDHSLLSLSFPSPFVVRDGRTEVSRHLEAPQIFGKPSLLLLLSGSPLPPFLEQGTFNLATFPF